MTCPHERHPRRVFLGLLAVGLAAACTRGDALSATAMPRVPRAIGLPPAGSEDVPAPVTGDTGGSRELRHGPPGTRRIALTVDDGDCTECVAGYVAFVARTGIHLTFSPNGVYAREWGPHAATLRPLIERGQVQVMNHTFSHRNLTRLPAAQVREELERNEEWVARTFATTTRPYYRPPYGFHNPTVDGLAAEAGFDRVVMWDGSFADSTPITPQFLLAQARRYLQPGVIMIGHANHPAVLGVFDQITALIAERALQPATLDEMFGTRRPG